MIFEFDGFNRMSGMETGGTVAEYEYNSDGLRISKTVNDERTDFVLEDGYVIAEIGFDNDVTNYVRGLTGIIYRKTSDGTKTYYVTNNHSDVTKLVNSSGAVIQTYTYDEYGNVTSSTGTDTNPFKYCGEYYDEESGLIYLRARYYSPKLGRFISEDPIRDDLNWYVYCGSNPVNAWDPLGLLQKPNPEDYPSERKYYDACQQFQNELKSLKAKDGVVSCSIQNGAVNFIETTDEIHIITYVKIIGGYSNVVIDGGAKTYYDATIDGIEQYWSGCYNGKSVSVYVIDSLSYHNFKSTPINIRIESFEDKSYSGISRAEYNGGKVYMYSGDSRNNKKYSEELYMKTAAHEMGHIFGVGDLYRINTTIPSIMNKQWEVHGAQSLDYAMIILAITNKKWYSWDDVESRAVLKRYGY